MYNNRVINKPTQKHGGDTMSEEAKKNLETISEKLKDIPKEVAAAAIDQYAARMEGFAEGFAAGKAHAENRPE
jgi:predicted transcriptional regulator